MNRNDRINKAKKAAAYQIKVAEPKRLQRAEEAHVMNRRIDKDGNICGDVARSPTDSNLKRFPDAFKMYDVRINGQYVRCDCGDMKYGRRERGLSACLHAIALSMAFLKTLNKKEESNND